MHYVCLILTHKSANLAILKHLRAFVENWLMSRFTRFLRKILAPQKAGRVNVLTNIMSVVVRYQKVPKITQS